MKDHWETSYTKRVITDVEDAYFEAGKAMNPTVRAALDLLQQYHKDMRVPYAQRDMYHDEMHRLAAIVRQQSDRLRELGGANRLLLSELAALRAAQHAPKRAYEYQNYMACGHYPNAISNFFEGRDSCEFCCEKEPLKWYDSGRHRMPDSTTKGKVK